MEIVEMRWMMKRETSLQEDGQQDYMYEQDTIDLSVMITNGLLEGGTKSERHGKMLAMCKQ
jgi:hypothetical protein